MQMSPQTFIIFSFQMQLFAALPANRITKSESLCVSVLIDWPRRCDDVTGRRQFVIKLLFFGVYWMKGIIKENSWQINSLL